MIIYLYCFRHMLRPMWFDIICMIKQTTVCNILIPIIPHIYCQVNYFFIRFKILYHVWFTITVPTKLTSMPNRNHHSIISPRRFMVSLINNSTNGIWICITFNTIQGYESNCKFTFFAFAPCFMINVNCKTRDLFLVIVNRFIIS